MRFFPWWGKKRVFNFHQIKTTEIATIKELNRYSNLSLKENHSLMLIDDCENTKRYWLEKTNASGKILGVMSDKRYGKYIKIKYTLFKSKKIRHTDFKVHRSITECSDWLNWKKINFLFKSENPTCILNFMIEQIDGNIWQYINFKKFKPKKWYLITIPFKKMYVFEKYLEGKKVNFKQKFDNVNSYFFNFSTLNGSIVPEEGPIKNAICIGKVFLTR